MRIHLPNPNIKKHFRHTWRNAKSLALVCAAAIVALYLTWYATRGMVEKATLFGIPLAFVLPVLLLPFFTLLLLDVFARKADDIDRHTPETENEQ